MSNYNYSSKLNIKDTEIAIKKLKDYFERDLAEEFNLVRVSAPLFVRGDSGINDNLNGVEKPVSFSIDGVNSNAEIVHSLAKWKRYALHEYGFNLYEGLYTDMNAIRKDEILDNIHSCFVDQWDWELIIKKEDRNIKFLKEVVERIYRCLKRAETYIVSLYPILEKQLSDEITFIKSEDLLKMYPSLSSKDREKEACKKYGSIFIIGIGKNLSNGMPHDLRSPDYDDWDLNGDILVYYKELDIAFELSSMGIRVDKDSLVKQLKATNNLDRLNLKYQSMLEKGELPFTVGGGIGQSRMCMFFLNKKHIGEVQSSIWTDEIIKECKENNIVLL